MRVCIYGKPRGRSSIIDLKSDLKMRLAAAGRSTYLACSWMGFRKKASLNFHIFSHCSQNCVVDNENEWQFFVIRCNFLKVIDIPQTEKPRSYYKTCNLCSNCPDNAIFPILVSFFGGIWRFFKGQLVLYELFEILWEQFSNRYWLIQ